MRQNTISFSILVLLQAANPMFAAPALRASQLPAFRALGFTRRREYMPYPSPVTQSVEFGLFDSVSRSHASRDITVDTSSTAVTITVEPEIAQLGGYEAGSAVGPMAADHRLPLGPIFHTSVPTASLSPSSVPEDPVVLQPKPDCSVNGFTRQGTGLGPATISNPFVDPYITGAKQEATCSEDPVTSAQKAGTIETLGSERNESGRDQLNSPDIEIVNAGDKGGLVGGNSMSAGGPGGGGGEKDQDTTSADD
ncbi:hypothetical protein FRB93_001269 [Tulasnella sp. JGI-2019a]|nr:hypothetical protein FRB93_001269 [Tulasnella sp. JGI-2019a]